MVDTTADPSVFNTILALNLLYLSFLLFFPGVAFVLDALRNISAYQAISNTPSSKIRSASMGLVELCGRPVRPEGLASPLSEEPCLYWRLDYRKFFMKRTMESEEPFVLDDGTGKVLVYPQGAKISFTDSSAWLHGISNLLNKGAMPKKRIPAHLARELGNPKKVSEHYLPITEQLYVLGDFCMEGERPVVRKRGRLFIGLSSEKTNQGNLAAIIAFELIVGLPMALLLPILVIFLL